MGVTSQNTRKYQYFLWLKHIVSSILATVDELDLAEALHPDDPEEVVDEQEDDDGGRQTRVEDYRGAEDVAEAPLHAEQSQQPENKKSEMRQFDI